jgi:hypothetical protein
VPIERDVSGIEVLIPRVPIVTRRDLARVEWLPLESIARVFDPHAWIEPGETIHDQGQLLILPPNQAAVKLHLRIVSKAKEWNAEYIVRRPAMAEQNNIHHLATEVPQRAT